MTAQEIVRYTMDEILEMRDRGESLTRPDAPEGPDLPDDFWEEAVVVHPTHKSVHLRLDGEVYDYFYNENNGKGHITKMQQVLAAYVRAQKKRQKASP